MGANAQTSVPTFTAGEILTAANMNISARTGIPVFATSTTRDAAFGGTGEKTLAEGQFAYLEDSNTTQYYDGSAWQSVGGSSGLTFITGASFTTAATVSFASGVFTSTYKNYLVQLNITAASTGQVLSLRVNNAGTPRTAANYYGVKQDVNTAGAATNTGSIGTTSLNFAAVQNTFPNSGYTITVYNPTDATKSTTLAYYGLGTEQGLSSIATTNGGCLYDANEANDGLTFFVSGTITGFYRVYGLSES